MLEVSSKEYKVKGYTGKWHVIDTGRGYALLEHCIYGDETCYLLVKRCVKIEELTYLDAYGLTHQRDTIMEVVAETYDDLRTTVDEVEEELRFSATVDHYREHGY